MCSAHPVCKNVSHTRPKDQRHFGGCWAWRNAHRSNGIWMLLDVLAGRGRPLRTNGTLTLSVGIASSNDPEEKEWVCHFCVLTLCASSQQHIHIATFAGNPHDLF